MAWTNVKTYLPRTLFGRAALIYLIPVLTILGVVAIVFIQRLYEDVTQQMTTSVADEVTLILTRIEDTEAASIALERGNEFAQPLNIELQFTQDTFPTRRAAIDVTGSTVIDTLVARFPDLEGVDLVSRDGYVRMAHPTRHGMLAIDVQRNRFSARNPHQFLVLIGVTALIMTLIALLYLRGQVRPIRRLAAAATAFGKGQLLSYRPSGAAEVRDAGQAFIEMRDRIERQIEQRTMMLSGVSHDLRTPLTRMRLALSLIEDQNVAAEMSSDISEMESMLNAFLDFSRDGGTEEARHTNLEDLVKALVSKFNRAGEIVSFSSKNCADTVRIQPNSVERAVLNLISNAVQYGNLAHVKIESSPDTVSIVVEDDGPGIPKNKREDALKPFARLDAARNQDAGSGVGLGLAIASDVARRHGGQVILGSSSTYGGLRAEIALPR